MSKSDPLGFSLVEAGQALYEPGHANSAPFHCTSGFAVHGPYGPFILTAGHCEAFGTYAHQQFPMGSVVMQGNTAEGTVAAYLVPDSNNGQYPTANVNPYIDAMLISTNGVRNNTGRVYETASDFAHPINGHAGAGVGDIVCQTGARTNGLTPSGTTCGPVQLLNAGAGGFNGYANAYTWAAMLVDRRDSGAAVYWNTLFGTLAAGIVQGCSTCSAGGSIIFTPIDNILGTWGLTIDTAS